MKLLIRGGSIAAGLGVTKSYVDILTESLLKKGIEVINRSRYRETTFDGIGTFNEDIAIFGPDILLVQFGVDDAFGYVYRSEFQENLVQMIRLARLRFNPIILLATSHTFDNPHDMDAVYIFYRSLRIVAADLGCELIPVHIYWAGYLEEQNLSSKDLVLSDSRYPNERGHQVIAEAMMKWLDKILPIDPCLFLTNSVNYPAYKAGHQKLQGGELHPPSPRTAFIPVHRTGFSAGDFIKEET